MAMRALDKDLIHLILQFLNEEKYKETVHKLEQESGVFLDLDYLEELVLAGKWDETEKYLQAFTTINDNPHTVKTFFEIRKQKYLEALDTHDIGMAASILKNDLKVFASYNENLYKEITQVLTLDDFRQNKELSSYTDAETVRYNLMLELKRLIRANHALRDKIQFPTIANARLRSLMNQSLQWKHSFCKNPRQIPEGISLFEDHLCGNPNDSLTQIAPNNQLLNLDLNFEGPFPLSENMAYQPTSAPLLVNHQLVSRGAVGFSSLTNQVPVVRVHEESDVTETMLPTNSDMEMWQGNSSLDIDHKVTDELPNIVARTLNQGSIVSSMDFHPNQQTILLVGTSEGEICLWEVSNNKKLVKKGFKSWNLDNKSRELKAVLLKGSFVSVKRVLWYMDGSLFGVAYSKNIVQLYGYCGGGDIQPHLEIEAHDGSVNDLAFCNPNTNLCLVTGGDDKTIKVWEVFNGTRIYTLEGHEAPVYSVCPRERLGNMHYLLSTSVDGKIKAWLYDGQGPKVAFDAPRRSCAAMACSTDGKRLFSCGTNKDGKSHIVEWNEDERCVRRTYKGLDNLSLGLVHFDTTKNKFLACSDSCKVKFWDMDCSDMLAAIDAEGGLQVSPLIRFNKDGLLLAVTENDNRIKILATVQGLRLMRDRESPAQGLQLMRDSESPAQGLQLMSDTESHSLPPSPVTRIDELDEIGKLVEINQPSQIRSLKVPSSIKSHKVSRLMYYNSGSEVLALSSNGIHLLWRWTHIDNHPTREVTTKASPRLKPIASGILMVNDEKGAKSEDATPCFAISKDDSYVVSAFGWKATLFSAPKLKSMRYFMAPPPAATCFAFNPGDRNVIAIGTDTSIIHIYNVSLDKVAGKLIGHSGRITSLAFSHELKKLVSFGDDARIIMWGTEIWEKQKEVFLQVPSNRPPSSMSSTTNVQFYGDHTHLLVVHYTQLAVYKTDTLQCVTQRCVRESSALISHATLSSDNRIVCCGFLDGIVRILDASSFRIICQINPSAYLGLENSTGIWPVAVAAHPKEPEQFALGLSNGCVYVIEPLEFGAKWGAA